MALPPVNDSASSMSVSAPNFAITDPNGVKVVNTAFWAMPAPEASDWLARQMFIPGPVILGRANFEKQATWRPKDGCAWMPPAGHGEAQDNAEVVRLASPAGTRHVNKVSRNRLRGRVQRRANSGVEMASSDSAPSESQLESICTSVPGSSVSNIEGRVSVLSREPLGCREIQRALEDAPNEDVRDAIAYELQGKIWENVFCPYGNFVVQKIMSTLRTHSSQFVVDEILEAPGTASRAARHKFGCRVLQRILEHCRAEQLENLISQLFEDALSLSRHPYGNYVMQHVLEYGNPDQQKILTNLLRLHVLSMGSDPNACAVLTKALIYGDPLDQTALASSLVDIPGLLPRMSRTRHGHSAVRAVLWHLAGDDLEDAMRQITAEQHRLKSTRYGRSVLAALNNRTSGENLTRMRTDTTVSVSTISTTESTNDEDDHIWEITL